MQRSNLFDHLIGAAEQRERKGEAECPGGFKVDDQFNFRGLLHRQVRWLLALANPAGIDTSLSVDLDNVCTIAHQSAGRSECTVLKDRWQRVAQRQSRELAAAG